MTEGKDTITIHKCPACGWTTTDEEYYSARYNYKCPMCGKSKLSQFGSRTIPWHRAKEAE